MRDRSNREKLGRTAEEIRSLLAKAKAEGNRGLTSDERERFHRLETEYTELEDTIAINESGSSILERHAEPLGGGPRVVPAGLEEIQDSYRLSPRQRRERDEADPHFRAFSSYLRGGMEAVDAEGRQLLLGRCPDPQTTARMNSIRNAMSTTTGSQGGFLVPQGFSDTLESAKKWFGGIKGVVGKITTETGNPMPYPTVNDTTNRGRIMGQNTQVVETDLVFGEVTFNSYIGSSDIILVPLALIEDSFFDLNTYIAEALGTRLGRLYNWKCTIGAGTTEPTGIVTAAAAAGNVLQLPAGNWATIAYGNLVDLEHSVDPVYRYSPSSNWMFSDAMLKLLKKLVDGNGRPLWQPGLSASFREGATVDLIAGRPQILDHDYIVNQDMASPAASAYSMLFGDMSKFKVRELASGTTVLVFRERFGDYLQVGYTAFQRFDSNLVDAGTHPIAVLQQSAD